MADTHPAPDIRAAAKALVPVIAARAAEIETARRLPADIARDMARAGIFRMVTPASLGGLELTPLEIVETVEILAGADASAGWCAMIAATTALNAAYMAPDHAREIYSDPETITGGVFAPMGRAYDEGDNYRVTGRWQWGSGSANCNWLCGGCIVFRGEEMVRLPSGAPDNRMMVFPAGDAELIDTWHTMGLKGTGSGDIAVSDILVPKGRSVSLVADRPRESGALYAFPAFGLLALGVAAAASGNARAALSEFRDLALAKKNQGSAKTLSERAVIQSEYARLDACLTAARAYLLHEIDRSWDAARAGGAIPLETRADLRLACTHMVRTAADVCRSAHDLAGGVDVYSASSIQRRFRDAHAMTAHIVTAPATYELIGRILLDQPTDGGMV